MIEEGKYCNDVMKKHFRKELLMTKEDNEKFKNSNKYWIFDNDYIDSRGGFKCGCRGCTLPPPLFASYFLQLLVFFNDFGGGETNYVISS